MDALPSRAVTVDVFEKLRARAMAGLPAAPGVVSLKRPRAAGGPPAIPAGLHRPDREELPFVLTYDAERWWHRATPAWAPSMAKLKEAGVVRVQVGRDGVTVVMRNGTHRARGLPSPWVPVVVAALTGRELVPVRRALRRGTTEFTPERLHGARR